MDGFVFIFAFSFLIGTLLTVADADNKDNPYYPVPRELGSFGDGDPIYGIFRVKENLTLVRDSASHLEIYDVHRRNDWKGKLEVEGMKGPYDLVGGDDCRSLFITDWWDATNIITVSTKSQNQVDRFPMSKEGTVVGLAATKATSDSDVIVTYSQSLEIKEFTKFGALVRRVPIPPSIAQPRHTIKLASGKGYAVCHGYGPAEKHRVCLLDNSGTEIDCFGGFPGKGKDKLDVCARIAEDADQNIIVADRNNKRVILLSNQDGKLRYVAEIVRERDGLSGPIRIFLDGPILYVVDNTFNEGLAVSGKVLVFRVKDGQPNF